MGAAAGSMNASRRWNGRVSAAFQGYALDVDDDDDDGLRFH